MAEAPKLPTVQELSVPGKKFYGGSTAFMRLRWSIRAPASSAIFVIDSAIDHASPQQPYYSPSHPGGIHPIASEPATDPPVSSMRFTVSDLDMWADDWETEHHEHELLSRSREFDENDPDVLVRCCGETRPGPGPCLDIPASTQPFVTVKDIIEAIHPWLLRLEDNIRVAKGLPDDPLEKEVEMYVYPIGAVTLTILDTRRYAPSMMEWWWERMAASAEHKLKRQAVEAGEGTGAVGEGNVG
jgi:hypothetical protein